MSDDFVVRLPGSAATPRVFSRANQGAKLGGLLGHQAVSQARGDYRYVYSVWDPVAQCALPLVQTFRATAEINWNFADQVVCGHYDTYVYSQHVGFLSS